jgi:cyanophycinase
VLGVGIDEDTAIRVEGGRFDVLGAGAVYVVDGAGVTHSNIAEAKPDRALSMYDVRLHVLSAGDGFDLAERRPAGAPELATSTDLQQRSD